MDDELDFIQSRKALERANRRFARALCGRRYEDVTGAEARALRRAPPRPAAETGPEPERPETQPARPGARPWP